ncbi:O-antigen ligase family protein [Flavobacteriaceae bacterium F08102]|nr:O-antigen ligase family protein [Flavobacteriaceae bacterium F08102]
MGKNQITFNVILIKVLVFGPIVAFITYFGAGMDFQSILQLFSYIGVALVLLYRKPNRPVKFPTYLLFYLLFIIYVFYSDLYRLQREFKVIYLFKNYIIGGFNLMFILENVSITKKQFAFIYRWSKIFMIIAVIVIVYQQVVDPNFFLRDDLVNPDFSQSDNDNRLPSIYSWIGSMAAGFTFVPLYIAIVEYEDRRKKKILPWLLAGLLFVLLTKARWTMVNGLLVFAVLFIKHKDITKRIYKYIIILPILLVGTSFALSTVGIDINGIVEERILESDKADINEKSASSRLLAFTIFGKFFKDNPIFGTGNIKYGMGGTGKQSYKLTRALAGRSSQIHVGYLSLLYLYGIVGGFFFLGFLFLILRKLYLEAKISGMWAPFLGYLGFALANATLVTFDALQMGLLLMIVYSKYFVENSNNEETLLT